MQCLARKQPEAVPHELLISGEGGSLQYFVAPVLLIVEEWMALPGHVYPYLVGATGLEAAFDERHVSQRLDDFIVGDGMFSLAAVGKDLHDAAVADVAAHIAGDGALLWVGGAPYQCEVAAPRGAVEKLFCQLVVGIFVLGNYEQSRGVLVNAVHQSRPQLPRLKEREIPEVVHKRIHECAGVVAVGRMHNHARCLVNHY